MNSVSLQNRDDLNLNSPMILQNGPLPLLSYRLFEPYSNVTNIITTRLGGVSAPPYHELNLALSTQDDSDAVLENRRRLCAAIGIELEHLTIGQLIQGLTIATVTEELRGRGALDRAAALQGTDGLVTNLVNTPLAILVADCTVISYYDPVKRVVALAHAGWRGTAGKIAAKMVAVMHDRFGCEPSDIIVGLGPNLGRDDMQVRDDVLAIFHAAFGDPAQAFFSPHPDGESYLLDLNAALLHQLEESGIRRDHIAVSSMSTASTDLFYSHRLEHGKTGRFAGVIVLRS